jgi:hypothetical protein
LGELIRNLYQQWGVICIELFRSNTPKSLCCKEFSQLVPLSAWLQNYVNNKLAAVPRQIKVSDKLKGKLVIECDEMWSFIFSKTIKVYIWRLIDRKIRKIIGGYARR